MAKQKKVVSRTVAAILLLLFIAPVIGVIVDSLWENHLRNSYGPALPYLSRADDAGGNIVAQDVGVRAP